MKSALKLLIILVSVALLFAQNHGYVLAQLAANTATFSLSPATGSFADNFSVDVKVTTATGTSISTLRADIVYPSDKLEVTSLDTSGSIVPAPPNGTWLNLDKNTPGVITLSATITTSYTSAGQPGQFAKINFKVKSGGTSTLTFQNTSAIYLYQPGATTATNILSDKTGGTYTVSVSGGGTGGTTATPTPTTSGSGNLPNAGNEIPTLILIASGVSLILLGSKKLLFSSL